MFYDKMNILRTISEKLNEEFILILTGTLQRETEQCELSLLLLKVLPAIPAIPC